MEIILLLVVKYMLHQGDFEVVLLLIQWVVMMWKCVSQQWICSPDCIRCSFMILLGCHNPYHMVRGEKTMHIYGTSIQFYWHDDYYEKWHEVKREYCLISLIINDKSQSALTPFTFLLYFFTLFLKSSWKWCEIV